MQLIRCDMSGQANTWEIQDNVVTKDQATLYATGLSLRTAQ